MNTRPGRSLRRREALTGYAFVLPQLIGFTCFVLIPLVNVFIYSFHNKNMLFGTNIFIGLDNYTKLFTNDSLFWMTLGNTFVFSVLLVPLNLVLALLLALYLGAGGLATRLTRTVIFLPVVPFALPWAIVSKKSLLSATAVPRNCSLSPSLILTSKPP